MIAAIVSTKALWYLARGTGAVSLLLLTATFALGIGGRRATAAPRIPRFATQLLHRNLSLLALAFIAVHVTCSVLDPFAGISWTDAVIPLAARYRPLWLGLGAVAFDLLLALAITSLVRVRLGLRAWRAVHWLAYACWPIALLHGLGTGSDVRSSWLLGLVAANVAVVVAAVWWRLAATPSLAVQWRLAAGFAVALAPLVMVGWLQSGPLHQGWAQHAGTPTTLLRHTAPTGTRGHP